MKLRTGKKRSNQTEDWLFEKFNKVDTFLTRLPKKKEKKIQITNIRNEETSLQTLDIFKGQRNTISNLGP